MEDAKFWTHVTFTDTCWLWHGAKTANGYGKTRRGGKTIGAHRWAYFLEYGELPPRPLVLDHTCGTPSCVRPAHLEPVTQGENLRRGPTTLIARNVAKTQCPQGHPYTLEKDGTRSCRECKMLRRNKGYGRGLDWRSHLTHCRHGHPFDEINTYIIPGVGRKCRACDRARHNANYISSQLRSR